MTLRSTPRRGRRHLERENPTAHLFINPDAGMPSIALGGKRHTAWQTEQVKSGTPPSQAG